MPFGGVRHELVFLQQLVHRSKWCPSIHIQHHHVEANDGVFFRTVIVLEVMVCPVCSLLLSHHMELVKRDPLIEVVVRPMVAVRDDDFIEVGFFELLALKELNAVHETLLDDDVLFVAPGCSQGHQFIPSRVAGLVVRQCFVQVGMGHFRTYVCDVFGQLDVSLLAVEDRLECSTGFLHQLDSLHQVFHLDVQALINEGICTCQLQRFEVPMGHFCLADFFMVSHGVCCTFAVDLVAKQLNTNRVIHNHLPAVHSWISQLVKVGTPLIQRVGVGWLGQPMVDFFRREGVECFPVILPKTKQTTACISCFQECIKLVFSLTTIQQSGWRTKQQGIGWSLAIDLFAALVFSRVLCELLLDLTLIKQLKEQGQHIS